MTKREVSLALVALGISAATLLWVTAMPQLWLLAVIAGGSLMLLVLNRLMTELSSRRRALPLHRLRQGLCAGCGYDVRGIAEFCPECGRRIERPDQALPHPRARSTFWRTAPEIESALLTLQLRKPTRASVWASEDQATIAAVVAKPCRDGAGWPNDHFLPDDSFMLMTDDPEGIAWLEVLWAVRDELGVDLTGENFQQMEALTFREVVAEIERRRQMRTSPATSCDAA